MTRVVSRRWVRWLGGLYCLMLLAGFGIGFSFGTPSSSPTRKTAAATTTQPKLVAAASTKSTETTEPAAPKAIPTVPKTPDPKVELPSPPKKEEPTIEPKPTPKKTEPQPPDPKPTTPKGSTLVTFDPKIKKIFADKCLNCHGGADMKGGLDLRSLASTIKGGDSGEAIKPGEPDDSPLWQSVSSGMMPPKGKGTLTADEKKLIREWIAGGAK